MMISPLSLEPIFPCLLAMMLQSVVPSSPEIETENQVLIASDIDNHWVGQKITLIDREEAKLGPWFNTTLANLQSQTAISHDIYQADKIKP